MPEKSFEVLVVGAGPAGLAAACCASEAGRRTALIDDNPAPGGQIWRGESRRSTSPQASYWLDRLRRSRAEPLCGARVVDAAGPQTLLVDRAEEFFEVRYGALILATGARERFLPFPGWTLPNVMGVGGLQALVKGGLPIEGRSVVVAGSGPLLLAVAAYLHKRGARVVRIAEQAPYPRLARFAIDLLGEPAKLREAMRLRGQLGGVRYRTGCWPLAAEGDGRLQSVTFTDGRKSWQQPCDYLACGFGLVPNLELPALLGCEMRDGAVQVDEWQRTSVSRVSCAGETTGVGGLDLALAEGQIAGWAAAGEQPRAQTLFPERARAQRFKDSLDRAFALRSELKTLARADTLVCRCEDVALGRLRDHESWRAAKLQTRCGMGPCQGRVCGPAVEFLLGWRAESVRPPILPAPLARLAGPE
jgi:D-hydroxyproline dehydrogenase subunit alpha